MIFKWLIRPPFFMCEWTIEPRNQRFSDDGKFPCEGGSFDEAWKDAQESIEAHLRHCGGKAFFHIRPATFFERVFNR